MGAFTKRRDSEYEGEDINLNVSWISSPFSWVFYVLLIGTFRWALHYFVPSSVCSWELGWTVTHVVHGVVSLGGRGARRREHPWWGLCGVGARVVSQCFLLAHALESRPCPHTLPRR